MRGVARALPAGADESARLWPAFVEYRLLALSAFAYYVSIWADKVVVYIVKGGDAAAFYAAIAAVAWFSVIPAFAWIYVQVETAFYQRFRSFYAELEAGASLRELKQHAELISTEAKRILRGAAAVQVGATMLVIAAAPRIVAVVGLSPDATPLFRLAALGAGLQVFSLLEVLLLTYFDLRRDALMICGCLLRRRHRADRHLQRDRLAARDRPPRRLRDQRRCSASCWCAAACRRWCWTPSSHSHSASLEPDSAAQARLDRLPQPTGAMLPGNTAASDRPRLRERSSASRQP